MRPEEREGVLGSWRWSLRQGLFTIGPVDDVANWFPNVPGNRFPWFAFADQVVSLSVLPGVVASADLSSLFKGLPYLETVDLSGLDTARVTSLSHLFDGCRSLRRVEGLGSLDVSRVRDLSFAFRGCSSLVDLSALAAWRTPYLRHAVGMLAGTAVTDASFVLEWGAYDAWDVCELMTDPDADLLYPGKTFHDVATRWLTAREAELDRRRSLVDSLAWTECEAVDVGQDGGPVPDDRGVYVITDTDKGAFYVGQSERLASRVRRHLAANGNASIRAGVKAGDRMRVRWALLDGSGYDDPHDLEADVISTTHAVRDGYNRSPGDVIRHDLSDDGLRAAAFERESWARAEGDDYAAWHCLSVVANAPTRAATPAPADGTDKPRRRNRKEEYAERVTPYIVVKDGHHIMLVVEEDGELRLGPLIMTPQVAAKALGVTVDQLREWRRKQEGPSYYKVSNKTIVYSAADIEAWLDANGVDALSRLREQVRTSTDRGRTKRRRARRKSKSPKAKRYHKRRVWKPWDTSIDYARMHRMRSGDLEIAWRIRMPDGSLKKRFTRISTADPDMREGSDDWCETEAELREYARAKAEEMRRKAEGDDSPQEDGRRRTRKHRKWKPWDTSIDTARMHRMRDGQLEIMWRICMPDGKLVTRFTRTSKANPRMREGSDRWREVEGGLRERARAKAEAMRRKAEDEAAASEGRRVWRASDLMADYVTEVALPAVRDNADIAEGTREDYVRILGLARALLGEATIGDLMVGEGRAKAVVDLLLAAEARHGTNTARHLRSVLDAYVFGSLVTEGVADALPLAPGFKVRWRRVDLGSTRRSRATRAGLLEPGEVPVVSPADRVRVIEWLLADDAEAYAASGRHGGQTPGQVAAGRRRACDLALLQATCGLRIHEALTLTAGHVGFTEDGIAVIEVTDANSKTHHGRKVPVFDPVWGHVVSDRLRERTSGLAPGDHVFAAVKTAGAPWEYRNAHKVMRRLYDEMADALDIPVLRCVSTHVWRASLNTEYLDPGCPYAMPEALRVALLGHTKAVNAGYYTAAWTPEDMLALVTERGGKVSVLPGFVPRVIDGGRGAATGT